MKTNLSARVLSWLLALCMLVGIAPAIPAESAQAADEGVYVYSFSKPASINLLVSEIPDGVDSFDDTTEGQPWKFVSKYDSNTFRNYSIGASGLYVGSKGTATTSIVLKLPEAGYYDVTAGMLAQLKSSGTSFTFTACDENGTPIEGAVESAKYWVEDMGPAWTYPVSSVGKHYFDCEYVLVKYAVYRIDGTYYSTYLKNLTLTKLNLDIDVETPPAIALDDSAVIPVVASTVSAAGKSAVALTAVSASSDLVDIALVDGKVVATAKKLGTEAVPVTFTAAGVSETVNIVFSVYDNLYNTDKTYTYNIMKGTAPASPLQSIYTNYNMMTPGATGEVNSQFASSPWKIISSTQPMYINNRHNYGAFVNKFPATIEFKFLLPENGIYNYYGKHATHSSYAADVKVSLQKVGAAEGDEFFEKTYIGTVNTATTDAAWSWDSIATNENLDLALTAGEYILTWEPTATKGSYCFFDGFEFVGQEGMNLEVEADDAIVSGTEAYIPVSVSGATGEVSYEVSAPEGVEAYMDGDELYVYAEEYGVYTVSILAGDIAGRYGRRSITVMMMEGEVEADEYVYDFTIAKPAPAEVPEGETAPILSVGASAIEGIDDIDLSLKAGSAPWKYLSGDEGVLYAPQPSFGYYAAYPGLVMTNSRTSTHSLYKGYARKLVVYVPDSGTYDASFDIAANADGSFAIVKMIPCDADGNVAADAATITFDHYLDFQTLPGNDTKSVVNYMNKVNLNAGFYVLSIDLRKNNSNDFFAGINKFILTRDVAGIEFDAPAPIKVDDSVEVAISSNVAITEIEVEDNFIANIALNDAGNAFVVTGLAKGSDVIEVGLWLDNGSYITVNVPVYVYDDTAAAGGTQYIYNLFKATTNDKINYVDSFNKTISDATGEINAGRFSAPWKAKAGVADAWIVTDPTYGALTRASDNAGMVIRVPETGKYKIYARYWGYAGAMNLDTTITDAEGTTTALTTVDTAVVNPALTGDAAKSHTALIGDMELEAGDYTLSFGISPSSSTGGGSWVALSGIILKVVDDEATATLSYPEVEIDGTAEPTLTVDTTATSYSIAYASDNEAVATVDPATGVVTGVSAGTAKITVTISGNAVATAEYTVTVKEAAPAYQPGDVNGDGKLNTRDVTTLRRYLAGGYEDSITVIEGMTDVNGDGRENTRDVAALRLLITG